MNYSILTQSQLFKGIQENDMKHLLTCISGREKSFKKGEIIYNAGETVSDIGLVIEGGVNIVVNFLRGNSNILGHVEPGKIFAESYAAAKGTELICDVVAAIDSKILFLNFEKLLTMCSSACTYHTKLIHNLLRILALKNLGLSNRIMHTASKYIRDRLFSYFSEMVMENGSRNFTIPFSRQELADYLNVDRSALSNELSKMQKEGLISYKKNSFSIKQDLE